MAFVAWLKQASTDWGGMWLKGYLLQGSFESCLVWTEKDWKIGVILVNQQEAEKVAVK